MVKYLEKTVRLTTFHRFKLRNEPEFQQIVRDMEAKYHVEYERVRKWLEEHGKL